MTKEEQIKFMENAMERMMEEFMKHMEKGEIPENWDGFELRWLLRDMGATFVWSDMDKTHRARFKEYKNTVLLNNLV